MATGVRPFLPADRELLGGTTAAPALVRACAVDRRPLRRSGLARMARVIGAGPVLPLPDLDQLAAVCQLASIEPELVVLGLEAGEDPVVAVATARRFAARVLVVVDGAEHGLGQRALSAGADGFLLSDELGPTELSHALAVIDGGRRAVPHRDDVEVSGSTARTGLEVSQRCRQVLVLLADGLHDGEIGAALGISTSSVRKHVAAAQERLGARTRTQAVAMAAREGLL